MKRSRARAHEAVEFARAQRASANEFANTVWQWVRNRQVCGQKFRREYAIPPYAVDFCCVESKLILESDGAEHMTEHGRERDRVRDEFLERRGYRVVRIAGYDVLREPRSWFERIEREVEERLQEMEAMRNPSPPAPLPEAGRGEIRHYELARKRR
jgi:very-short-patch-repair endonuclease